MIPRFSFRFFSILFIFLIITGCNSRSARNPADGLKPEPVREETVTTVKDKVPAPEKVIFFIENSGSMFGYVNRANEFKNSLVGLAYLPEFDKVSKRFYFINGKYDPAKRSDIRITYVGDDPETLKNKLDPVSFNTGDVRYSDLNEMFRISLDSAKGNQIAVLVSDCIYDVGAEDDPLTALNIETHKTQQSFRNRLENEDVQTLIIKTVSKFDGDYFYASKKGSVKIADEYRPFYIIFFGRTEYLNELLTEESIAGRMVTSFETARFLVNEERNIPYQVTPSLKRIGSFKLDFKDNFHLTDAESLRGTFQFTIAADFSSLPFSDSYYASVNNYECLSSNYRVLEVEKISKKTPGIEGTHLITLSTGKNPLGEIELVLKNTIPQWIGETDSRNEDLIDSDHTYGFSSLTDAISKAYEYKNNREEGRFPAVFRIRISN